MYNNKGLSQQAIVEYYIASNSHTFILIVTQRVALGIWGKHKESLQFSLHMYLYYLSIFLPEAFFFG